MFISAFEKERLKTNIENLSKLVGDMNAELLYMGAKIKALEAQALQLSNRRKPAKKKLTEAQRLKQREYARKYQAKKRLEKQNANSVRTTGQ
jgi:enoyl-CoA hydratase/carnithine racemase